MKKAYEYNEQKKSAFILLTIAIVLFFVCIGFFTWHTVRMRNYELNYVEINGTVVDIEQYHHSTKKYYRLVISYNYNGQEYKFTDRTGHKYISKDIIENPVKIYVNPKSPNQAEMVTSSDFVSIISACFFAFSYVTYAVGMNLLLSNKGTSFKKRCIFVWGLEILFGIAFLLLFWLGLPNSNFGEVFISVKGAIGVTVVLGLVLCVTLLDGFITYKSYSKNLKKL